LCFQTRSPSGSTCGGEKRKKVCVNLCFKTSSTCFAPTNLGPPCSTRALDCPAVAPSSMRGSVARRRRSTSGGGQRDEDKDAIILLCLRQNTGPPRSVGDGDRTLRGSGPAAFAFCTGIPHGSLLVWPFLLASSTLEFLPAFCVGLCGPFRRCSSAAHHTHGGRRPLIICPRPCRAGPRRRRPGQDVGRSALCTDGPCRGDRMHVIPAHISIFFLARSPRHRRRRSPPLDSSSPEMTTRRAVRLHHVPGQIQTRLPCLTSPWGCAHGPGRHFRRASPPPP
jgi:hypothetical protein